MIYYFNQSEINKRHGVSCAAVYCIHGPERKVYIGKAANIRRRFREHYLDFRKNKHKSKIQAIWNKYNGEGFYLEILEQFPTNTSDEILLPREQYWLDFCSPNVYNMQPVTGSPLGFKHTSEALLNMKIIQNSEHIIKVRQNQGRQYIIKLQNGLVYQSLKEFVIACGWLSGDKAEFRRYMKKGLTYDDIAVKRGLQTGNIKDTDSKNKPIILPNGLQFKNQSEFSKACGYATTSGVAVALCQGKTYEQIARKRGLL